MKRKEGTIYRDT